MTSSTQAWSRSPARLSIPTVASTESTRRRNPAFPGYYAGRAWTLSPSTWESEITQRSVTRRFAHDPKEVARARHLVRTELEAWDLVADLPALELAVSELVTNAIVHGHGQVEVHMEELDGCVRLEVRDEGAVGASPPTVRSDDGEGGWGLRLVEGLSDTWGTWCDDGSTHVWMERRTQGRGR